MKSKLLISLGCCLVLKFCLLQTVFAQSQVTVTGIVRDMTGEPLPSVTVEVKDETGSTKTDSIGQFTIPVSSLNATLTVRALGYLTVDHPLNGNQRVELQLTPSAYDLDEVVVVGYGTARKKDLTGAVTQVSAEKLENETPNSVQDLLRGNVAGLNVGFAASAKGTGSLQVRGQKSLNAGGTPLIVLDGVIYNGDLTDINPTDIQQVDVLKDASSAAVYGAKAANGVIIVTTKQGKSGIPAINFNLNNGFTSNAQQQPVYGPEGYLNFRRDVLESTNENAKPYQFWNPQQLPADISIDEWLAYDASSGDPTDVWLKRLNLKQVEIDNYKAGRTIDWYDRVFHTGRLQDYNLSVSNAKEGISYYYSLGYEDNQGVVVDDRFKTLRSRLNIEGDITRFLKVGVRTQFSDRDESQVPVNWQAMVYASPWGSEFQEDGHTLRLSPQDDPAVTSNPFLNPAYTDRSQKYTNLISTLFAHVKLPFGITYQLNYSPRFQWYRYFNHQSSEHPTWAANGGMAARNQSVEFSWQVDNLLKWNKTLADVHYFDVTLLANAEKFQYWLTNTSNQGFSPDDQLGYHDIGSGIKPVISSNDEYSTGDALMGRFFYSYDNRYLITLSARRDGYSAFGQKNPRAFFPSVAVGWTFTEESFAMPSWLNFGKIRLSYGVNGNRDIGRYAAISKIVSDNYIHIGNNDEVKKITTLEVSSMSNRDLKWERTAATNLGLDFAVLNNRVSGNIELYNTSTSDLLVMRSLPRLVGYNSVMTNLGEVNNRGVEVAINSINLQKERFTWNTSFNISYNRNRIVHLYGDMEDIHDAAGNVVGQKEADDRTNKWFIGRSIDEIWDLKVLGVYQVGEEEEAARYGVKPGDFKIEDVNNDGKYTDEDRQFLGNTVPKFRSSLRNEFSFLKCIDFSFMVYAYWGHKGTFNEAKNIGNQYLDRTNFYVLPYWTSQNPLNDFAQLSSSDGGSSYNVYRNKSFLRIDNIALAYRLPQPILSRVKITNMKVFANIKNAALYTPGFFLWDPESTGPTPRTITLGVNVTL